MFWPAQQRTIQDSSEQRTTESNQQISYKELLLDYRIYFVFFGFSAFSLRLTTFNAWIGSGWPVWIADEQFTWTMNNILGYGNK